ncbi:alpha/beta fold hydrolase [Stakelama tenebrarum]|nr:alpha/beta fold hydrolase [Sphingosinithalassobacter tenebrarum]
MLRSETATSPERRARALAGLRAYQQARRAAPRPETPVFARAGRAVLRDYGGWGRPLVVVPSLINPPWVLDLARGNSLMRWLARQGVRPMLVDWGSPTPEERDQDITAHVEQMLLPLIRALPRPPLLAGYCLGGTMAMAAASATQVAGLAMIAAPWRFAGYGDALATMDPIWQQAHPSCEALGLVPIEVLQAGFWQLDPGRTVAKYERFSALPRGSAEANAFVALEDWANKGAPLTYAVGRQLFDDFLSADLPGSGRWRIEATSAGPEALSCPAVEFVSANDRIVPAATAAGLADSRILSAGHVGMITGGRGRQQLWEPLADWLRAHREPR